MESSLYAHQVARDCGITMRAVRLAVQQGRLKAFPDPRYRRVVYRFILADVEAFKAGRKRCR